MTTTRRIVLSFLALILILLLYLLLWPVPISPRAWTPAPAPTLAGPYQQNSALASIEKISVGEGYAPEDVAVAPDGRIYAGMDDGRIMRVKENGTDPELFADTGGRPLGLKFDSTGNLIVTDAIKGILAISPDASIRVLSIEADGLPFRCPNDLDISNDGTVYFTDASSKFPLSVYKADLLEHAGNGRFLAFDPKTKTTRTILRDLNFANGVAVSPDQSFVLVVETARYRVHRVWLTGPKKGQAEIFLDNLPGFPDGITSNGRDKFWLALVTPRDKTLDTLLPRPFLRKVVMRLPKFLQPAPRRYSFVLGLDTNGQIVENLQNGSPDCYAQIANAVEHDGSLYFGSIGESAIGRYRLPQ
jgi:sugar lactone lactonase YvrE